MANQHHNPYLTPTIGQARRRAPRPLIWLPDQLDMFEQRIADTGAVVSATDHPLQIDGGLYSEEIR